MYGVKNVMPVAEARKLRPDIVLVPQKPDLYRRAHNALLSEIGSVIPIDTVKSIDELTCRLDEAVRADRQLLSQDGRFWRAGCGRRSPPARACFQARLANPDMKVEMIMICAAP